MLLGLTTSATYILQSNSDQPSSFMQACEQLGIEQFELKGRVCRRSSGVVRPVSIVLHDSAANAVSTFPAAFLSPATT